MCICVCVCARTLMHSTYNSTYKNVCDTMKGVRQADDIFVCFGAKPNKGLSSRSRRDRK